MDEEEEEQGEVCTSQEGLKQETDASVLTPTDSEHDHSEAEPSRDPGLLALSSQIAKNQDQKGTRGKCLV